MRLERFGEYHVPVHLDVPSIEVIYTDIPTSTRRSVRAAWAK
jgi:CO/xanthine dehydrogenase Mo-binding subunit